MSELKKFMDDINSLKVPTALLGEVTILWASLSAGDWKDFDGRLAQVVDLVTRKGYGEESPMLAMAVALRLMALDAMVVDPANRGWLVAGPRDGITYIHGDFVKAAAEELLLEGPNGEPTFAPESFRARLMRLAAVRGQA